MDIHLDSYEGTRVYIKGDEKYKKGEEMVYV